ncbi:acetyl-CoA hydrolase/transferase family protein [Chloroflexota bacterium]
MDWKADYRLKTVSPQEVVEQIKSGDRVIVGVLPEPSALLYALAARKAALEGTEIHIWAVGVDCGWYDPGWEKSFPLKVRYGSRLTRPLLDNRTADFLPTGLALEYKTQAENRLDSMHYDVYLGSFSPPDRHGYCSFGNGVWGKKRSAECSNLVIGEIDKRLIRTYGENRLHVSEIDYIVEHTPDEPLRHIYAPTVEKEFKVIAQYISTIVKDGDCIQQGTGSLGISLCILGAFDGKHDLGLHTEQTPPGLSDLIEQGIFTCQRKNFHHGKVVCTQTWPDEKELEFVNENPMFELYDASYVNAIPVIAANDNQVAINEAIAIDLTGQICASNIGSRPYSGLGGHLEHHLGALFSKGGRAITMIPSTAKGDTISRIVPFFEQGTAVAVPNSYADYVVTEYGIARLMGKSYRERATELIAIAHPSFQNELRKQADKLLYP